jgi:hypothetical protein
MYIFSVFYTASMVNLYRIYVANFVAIVPTKFAT